ncbi:hypothetical protein Goarm_000979 [Gossypium armourianum]|uniref:Uncharacterized protein n=1 Tax=Gossypium armourianum TaxID=34283 RepID=A0A7J9KBQ8_9ROSI|nr:hypothetical protein [Gossypium armourianum]
MENGFLDKVEDNAVVRIWAETTQQEKGDSITEGMTRSSNYSTIIMVICLIYSISKLTSTYFELSPNIGTLLIVVLLLERWIWYLLWKSTRLFSVTRRFKLTK